MPSQFSYDKSFAPSENTVFIREDMFEAAIDVLSEDASGSGVAVELGKYLTRAHTSKMSVKLTATEIVDAIEVGLSHIEDWSAYFGVMELIPEVFLALSSHASFLLELEKEWYKRFSGPGEGEVFFKGWGEVRENNLKLGEFAFDLPVLRKIAPLTSHEIPLDEAKALIVQMILYQRLTSRGMRRSEKWVTKIARKFLLQRFPHNNPYKYIHMYLSAFGYIYNIG